MNTCLIIADLHLSPKHPKTLEKFYYFLDNIAPQSQALILLGDIFEQWLGDDDQCHFNRDIMAALQKLKQGGVALSFITGNRDFALGDVFAHQSGCERMADVTVKPLAGLETLLLHGDTLCTDDIAYQQYRAKIRAPTMMQRLARLPLWMRRCLAVYLRLRSRLYQKKHGVKPITDVNTETVLACFKQYHANRMIHGHTHRPGIHHYYRDGQTFERWVLSDWGKCGNYLAIDEHGMLQLRYF